MGSLPACDIVFWYCGQRWHSSTGSCTISLSPISFAFFLLCLEWYSKAPIETVRTGPFNFQCAQICNSLCVCVCMYACVRACVCGACVHACMHVCVCINALCSYCDSMTCLSVDAMPTCDIHNDMQQCQLHLCTEHACKLSLT